MSQRSSRGTLAGALLLAVGLVACGKVNHAATQAGGVPPTVTVTSSPSPCPVPVARLDAMRAHGAQAPGTISASDSRIAQAYKSKDSRNYATQASGAELTADGVGLPGSFPDGNARFWVVVSHGVFDPSDAEMSRQPAPIWAPGGPTQATPAPQRATVAYVIFDAVTGQYKGEEFKYPGCAKE